MRRIFDVSNPIIMRPAGYSLKPGDPKYWDGFDAPLPEKQTWQRGRGSNKSEMGKEYPGVGEVFKS